jgi:DNA polymerase (family 10)
MVVAQSWRRQRQTSIRGRLAQLGERRVRNAEVRSSILLPSTNFTLWPLSPADTPMSFSAGIPLGRAHALASFVAQEIRRTGAPIDQLVPLGGLRRYAPAVDGVTLLAVAEAAQHRAALDALAALGGGPALHRSDARIAVSTERGPIDVLLSSPEHAGAVLAWHTGSPRHTAQLEIRATARGLRFDGTMLVGAGGPVECPSEEDLFTHLALAFVPPELREGHDELELAERGTLPQLLTTRDLRGDLHSHTTWSDGRDTVERMVRSAGALGYEYFAITDHSLRSAASRTLAPRHIAEQRAEIDAARALAPGLTVLHGVEVDIMPDGSLDFDDAVLAQFDIVLASLHDSAGHDAPRLLNRYLRAIEHPLVTIITHPANRTPAGHDGYELDFDRLFDAAARTGTALEVDGSPGHLDLDGALARRAVAAGATLVVDSDSHRADALARQAQFGVGTARRGGVEPMQVLNTQPLDAVLAFIARKRARG